MYRGVIVARLKPGQEQEIARIFAESDQSELPALAGVKHRSIFVLDDVYIHLVEGDDDLPNITARLRDHPLFREISRQLEACVEPYNTATWRSPKDAVAREIYSWDADEGG
jgi:cyclase